MRDAPSAPDVVLVEPESMNLLGLMLGSVIRRQLLDANARRHARALRGEIAVNAGGMQIVIVFGPNEISISTQLSARRPRTRIQGTLIALLDAALGRRRLSHVLRGELFAWGSPWALWHLLGLLRIAGPDQHPLSALPPSA